MAAKNFIPVGSNNNNGSTASLFEARKYYNNTSVPYITGTYLYVNDGLESLYYDTNSEKNIKNNKIPLADLYNENSLYGVLDTKGNNVIAPINKKSNAQTIPTNFTQVGSFQGKALLLQDFVAEAFFDMRNYLNEQVQRNCFGINNIVIGNNNGINSPFYNIEIKKAFTEETDVDSVYQYNTLLIASKFKELCRNDVQLSKRIKNINDFTKYYTNFLIKHLLVSPITKSRSHVFNNLKKFNNGLSFSISNDVAGNYETNYTKYFMDPAFLTFAKSCIRFGFRIDKNNPFILYADLNSPAMKEYFSKKGILNIDNFFLQRYKILFYEDLEELKNFYINSYKLFILQNKIYGEELQKLSSCNIKNVTLKYREEINNNDILTFKKTFNNHFIRLYVFLKNYELKQNLTQEKFEFIVKNAINIYNTKSNFISEKRALEFINQYFDETKGVYFFDSLSEKNSVVQSADSVKNELQF